MDILRFQIGYLEFQRDMAPPILSENDHFPYKVYDFGDLKGMAAMLLNSESRC